MEFQQLRYFLQLCEDKSFVTAAEHLYISQQALRKSVRKAEDELGVELVYRKGNSINLTPAGDCVRTFAALITHEVELMEATVKSYRNDAEYTLRSIVIEGLLSIQAGENPRVTEEKLKSFLAPAERAAYEAAQPAGGGGE